MSPRPSRDANIRQWRKYLAAERAEAMIYRDLAGRRQGEEREILLALGDAEDRHAQHWIDLLGPHAQPEPRLDLGSRLLGWFAKRFGSVFILALMQRAEGRTPYDTDEHASAAMAADEHIHGEVVRALAKRKRDALSGGFRAAVFGMNDGLVSNLALVLGVGATGMPPTAVLITGIAGLLAGALSMAAGEYISVSSQRELIDSSKPSLDTAKRVPALDAELNELALVYRARGMSQAEAEARARTVFERIREAAALEAHEREPELATAPVPTTPAAAGDDVVGSPWRAAAFSFVTFGVGALIPVLPYLFGAAGLTAVITAAVLVGVALAITGAITGVLSGASPGLRALRQVAIGYGAAAITYMLGLAFGVLID